MDLPVYVTVEEVQRVCKLPELRDWSALNRGEGPARRGSNHPRRVNVRGMNIDLEEFRVGLEVELEHGIRFADANVTNNHPVLTGKIVLAHLKEMLDYYERLEVAELEGDLFKALAAGKADKVASYYKRLIKAKLALSQLEAKEIS